MYKFTITHNNGKRQTLTDDEADVCSLMRLLDRCEIKSFKVELQ